MQVVNCSVRLGSNLNSVVRKHGVTVAEIMVLRAIHGADSVTAVQPVLQDKRSRADEMDRLNSIYNPATVRGVFPGAAPNLPVTLEDVGISRADCMGAPAAPKLTTQQKANAAGGKKAEDAVPPLAEA